MYQSLPNDLMKLGVKEPGFADDIVNKQVIRENVGETQMSLNSKIDMENEGT